MSEPTGRVPIDVLLDADLGDLPRAVAELVEAGADGLFTFEGPRDPFLPLAVAATVPGPALLYPNLAIALPRSPLNLAQLAWDLQRASGGRLMLGLGTQVRRHVVERYGSRWESPVEQMGEWLEAIRAIMAAWQERTPLQFQGRWTRHTYMPPLFDPGPVAGGPPPLVIGAVGPRMLRLATSSADGVLVHPFSSERTLREHTLAAVEHGLGAAARRRQDFLVIGQVMVAVGRDEDELATAVARSRAQVGFYASTPAYRVMLDVHGWGDLQPQLQALVREQRWTDLAAAVPEEVLAAFVCSGSPEEVARQLGVRAVGVDRLALSSYSTPQARLELLRALR
jgi:probable F420-dependent oxidoreductase